MSEKKMCEGWCMAPTGAGMRKWTRSRRNHGHKERGPRAREQGRRQRTGRLDGRAHKAAMASP
eukprot:4902372-Amphidinium_carterae.1